MRAGRGKDKCQGNFLLPFSWCLANYIMLGGIKRPRVILREDIFSDRPDHVLVQSEKKKRECKAQVGFK